ncbi:hypothetical protein LguiA_003208 [Lonicera macranthoides]
MSSPIVSESSCNWHSSHKEAFILLIEEEFNKGRIGLNTSLTAKQANPSAGVFKKKGLLGYETFFKIFKNTTTTCQFGRASIQGPLYSDEEMDVGGGPSMFSMDAAYVHESGANSRSSKRSKTSLDALMETMSETLRVKKAHYDAKATSAEEHTMIDCMSILKNMPVSGVQYGLAAERLISGKDWRSFFFLSNPDRQLEWVNGLK